MKANELMIGDWVEFIQSDGQGFYAQVEALNDDGTFAESGFFADNMVKPIPLTEDIRDMVSCHPKIAIYWDDRKTEQTGENWYEVRIHNGDESVLTLQLRYVHELQHALRLLGVENDICIKL